MIAGENLHLKENFLYFIILLLKFQIHNKVKNRLLYNNHYFLWEITKIIKKSYEKISEKGELFGRISMMEFQN